MSFINAGQKKIFFAEQYGNRGRTFAPIEFALRTSNANRNVRLSAPGGSMSEMGDGSFLFDAGKLRKIQLNYYPIQCDVEGSDSQTLCASPDEVLAPSQIDFEVTQKTTTKKYGLQADDIRYVDNNWDFSDHALEQIGSILPAMRKLLATDLTTYMYAKAGKHSDGNTTKRVPSAVSTTGSVNFFGGRITIDKEYRDAGLSEPNVLGGDEVYYWMKAIGLGGQQETGIQTNRIDSSNVWYDDGLGTQVKGDSANGGWVLAIDPAIFKFITYSNNAGLWRTDLSSITDLDRLYTFGGGADFILGVITDPVTGLICDLYVNFEKCASWNNNKPGWTFYLQLQWDIFVMPPVACNIPEFNGITVWRTCPAVVAACPTGDTPSPAIAATTRSWNPGSIFTDLTIYNATVGGVTVSYSEGVDIADRAALAALMNDATGNVYDFGVSGSNIQYDGVSNISVSFNDGAITGTFA